MSGEWGRVMGYMDGALRRVAGRFDEAPAVKGWPAYAETPFGRVALPVRVGELPWPRMVLPVLARPALCRVDREAGRVLMSRPMLKADTGELVLVTVGVGERLEQYGEPFGEATQEAVEASIAGEGVLWVEGPPEACVFKSLSFETNGVEVHVVDFGIVGALLGEPDLAKAQSIPAGARWITVHPNGSGTKGVPVLVQPHPKQPGVMSVIGGAGGKLNYLKLRGVKDPAEHAREASERAALSRQMKREQTARDKVLGVHEAKVAAKKGIVEQRRAAEREFIETVAGAMGWDLAAAEKLDDVDAGVDGASGVDGEVDPKVAKKAAARRHRELLAHARAAVELQRQALVADPQARQVAFAPVSSDQLLAAGDPLDASDLVPVRLKKGAGFSADFKGRAEKAGLTAGALDAEVSEIQSGGDAQVAAQQKARKVERAAVSAAMREQIDRMTASKPNLVPVVADAKAAVSLLAAHKALRSVQAQAAAAAADVDANGGEEPRAYVLAVSPASAEEVEADVADDLRTVAARSLLAAVAEGDADSLEVQMGTGSFNALNALSQTVAGAQLIDRSVVDVLGVAGAAQVLAYRLHGDLSPKEVEEVLGGLEDYHAQTQADRVAEAVKQAEDIRAQALDMDSASHGDDVLVRAQLAQRRAEHLQQADRVLGQTLGELEAHGAMVAALRGGAPKGLSVSMGRASLVSAVQQCRALGMAPGDYELTREGAQVSLQVHESGLAKLSAAMDPENVARVRRNLDIMEGRHDEDGWLPQGFANRADLAAPPVEGAVPSVAVPFEPKGGDLEAALADHVGSRFADGEPAAAILADIQSGEYFQRSGDSAGYRAALEAVAPNRSPDGKTLSRAEDLEPAFQAHADRFLEQRFGSKASGLNGQRFELDDRAQDAVHRALAQVPDGVLAYKPVGDLSKQERGQIREAFGRRVARDSPEAADLRARLEAHVGSEPERFVEDMFGGQAESPEWQAWESARGEMAASLKERSLGWGDYCRIMGGGHRAVAAVQDLIRSDMAAAFARHHNRLRPEAALRTGRASIRHGLSHLSAVSPAAREERLSKERSLIDGLRERVGGQYAAGGVADKVEQAVAEKQAYEQAQMGFFAGDGLGGAGVKTDTPMGADERVTIGHAAEHQLAAAVAAVGKGFKPGQPVKLFHASMSGPSGAARQRAIKHVVENKRTVLGLGVGSGKAQPLDARVLTPCGWARMGELSVGSEVIAGDGTVTRVTGVYPQGEREVFRVTMQDGGSTECCDEHLWLTTTEVERKRAAYLRQGRKRTRAKQDLALAGVRSLAEIRESLLVRHGVRNHHIPVVGVTQFEAQSVALDPYLLGALLGDGYLARRQVRMSTADAEVVGAIVGALPPEVELVWESGFDYRVTTGRRGGRTVNPVLDVIRALGLAGCRSHEKFVPWSYLCNSVDVRVGLLQGLMDTDGTVERRTGGAVFSTSSPALAEGMRFLVRSLGGVVRSWSKVPAFVHNGERRPGLPAITLGLSLPAWVAPFRLSRKSALYRAPTKYSPKGRVIVAVDPVGRKAVQCIAVDHPSHLYVTDDFIVTHNTGIALGAFAHLHSTGKVKKGIFAVPSIVQGQFGAEALRFLKPGQFDWHCVPGASRAERFAAYKDPGKHFTVVTHQALRDDIAHAVAEHRGSTPDEALDHLQGLDPDARKGAVSDAFGAMGVKFDYAAFDEAHGLLDRAGKEDSRLSTAAQALTDGCEYYAHASGDPVKNDASEAFSLLAKMDRGRYHDRDAFMRAYGGDTASARAGLQRELARHLFADSLSPDVSVDKRVETVPMSEPQAQALADMEGAMGRARLARIQGKVDVEAVRQLMPEHFAGVPAEQHEAVARELGRSLALVKESATRRIIDSHPQGGKIDAVARIAAERKGKPGVVFARSLAAVEHIKARLAAEGHRVATISGADSSVEKAAKIQGFNPDSGERSHDIVVCSDAAAVGANLQSGHWLVQADTPDTAMVHRQRQGRIDRIGQKNPIELIDLMHDHPSEHRARKRMATKYQLRDLVTTPLGGLDETGLAKFIRARQVGASQDLF